MKRLLLLGVAILATSISAATFPKDDQAVVHVLSRIGFGPRAGDVEKVRAMGIQRYIEEQLHPERIADAPMGTRLDGLTTLRLSSRQIAEQYELPELQARLAKKQNAAAGDGADAATPKMPDPMQQKANSLVVELSEQKLLRAVYSERQLQEVLTDFWFNHFNVDARKGRDRFLLTEYERDTIRPHVLGKFRDLLGATAKSPAMLFYLDNWMSADPNGPHVDMRPGRVVREPFGGRFVAPPMARPQAQGKNAPTLRQAQGRPEPGRGAKGLNENYGRELMELHTLGVDGGYTQKDVTEVARALTGWTILNPQQGGEFRFEPRQHDEGEKVVLGHHINAGGGIKDGEQVLNILASHPSTAHFISLELARRFVSDTPPAALVDRAAKRFKDTDGDLREVMRTILTSPEFLGPEAYRAKVKSPFEFIVSAMRATSADVSNAMALVRAMQQLGMPLYQCQPPTGYKDTADAWTNTGALVNRMNFALQLSNGKTPGIAVESRQSLVDRRDAVVNAMLGNDVSETTKSTIAKATTTPQMMALALGSPEFQKR